MKPRVILIIAILLTGFISKAQPPEIIYEGTLIASGFKQSIPLPSDGPFPIGFTFTFFGNPYTQFYVSANGLVMFTDPDGLYNTEATIPTASTPNNYIAPFWDNLSIVDGGNILYKTIGFATNRMCIIQFKNMGFDPVPTPLGTFSVILYETSNIIQIQYRLIVDAYSPKSHGESATIGLENSTGASGVLFAYHDEDAVTTEDAISFTPSGATYSVNSDTLYKGVFLTTNIALPDPGIVNLVSPPADAVIGANQTFEWSAASDASSYILVIDTLSSLATATYYYPGLNLTYDITNLLLNKTYYWAVFSSNATATTWCEIRRFTTTSAPPLAPVPQTIWTEQFQDKTIKLQYTGGDASPKTAIITSLPAQGQLYQYNAGARGSPISSASTPVTDAGMNVIYAATGSTTGNGVGNFKFKIIYAGSESPEGTITINVSPPGVPNVLYIAKSANVEIQFDIPMTNPSGKQDQFTVKVNSSPVTINSAGLKTGDPYTILLTLATPLTGSETVLVSYTPGNVTGGTGGFLLPFTDEPVTLLAQTIDFSQSLSKKYSDSPLTLTATASGGLITYSSSNMSVATVSSYIATFHALGASDITARQAGNATYSPARYVKTLTVAKGDQAITFNALPSKTYGDTDFGPGASASSGLTVSYSSDNPGIATINSGMIHITGAGIAIITASQSGNTNYNAASDVQHILTVNKANQTITFGALPSATYGDADINPGASASSGLLVSYTSDNPAVATIVSGMIHITGGGTAVITASQAGDANYNAAPVVPQTLTVNKANQTITFGTLSAVTYGAGDVAPGATASSGLPVSYSSGNTNVATIVGGMLHITAGGSSVITASQAGNANYNAAPNVQQTFTVNKVNLTFTAENKSKVFQQPNPDLTYIITGFVNGESQSVLDILPSIQTTALQNSPVGDYPITLSGGNDNCYNYVFVAGTLTITRNLQTITFTDIPEKLLVGDSYTLVAASTSGLTVLFESMNPEIAAVSGNQLTGVSKGNVRIRAYHPGDINFEPAEVFDTVEIYSTHINIMYLFTPDNDGFNDLWELPELMSWGKCDVRVFNRWGKLVFASPDYHNEWDGTSNGTPVPEGPYYFIIKTENAGNVTGTVNIVR